MCVLGRVAIEGATQYYAFLSKVHIAMLFWILTRPYSSVLTSLWGSKFGVNELHVGGVNYAKKINFNHFVSVVY